MSLTPEDSRYLNLNGFLTGDEATPGDREQNLTRPGREDFCDDFDVSFKKEDDVGFPYVNYSDTFTAYIMQLSELAAQALVGESQAIAEPSPRTKNWRNNTVFEFLYELTVNPELEAEFNELFPSNPGASELTREQRAFLTVHIPGDPYDVWNGILQITANADQDPLDDSVSDLVMAFQSEFQSGC